MIWVEPVICDMCHKQLNENHHIHKYLGADGKIHESSKVCSKCQKVLYKHYLLRKEAS